jgi:hypothetical protein
MNRLFSNVVWWLGGIVALVVLNSIFLVLVGGMDILFHVPPQFVIALFVPALCMGAGVLTILVRSVRRLTFAQRTRTSPEQATESAAGVMRWRSAPSLHSAVVIRRRNSTDNSNARERRAYASTV